MGATIGVMRSTSCAALCAGLALVLVGNVGCRRYPPPVPLDQLSPQQARGHAVFQADCAQCHYDRREGSLHGPSLVSLYKKPSLPSGAPANDERVTATILQGRNMMPPMGHVLDPQDLTDLLAYLHTL
jgi:mono/diheme cytochrome c family protein